ncbi:hypothetical protein [uncultured Prevotellamassilia sp.]|uniref:hypothetical protein n=1 Tax=uncultured Prevotellamassilia sp. TaxID=1926676 RepID=UPI002586B518|nr:hypothetical protein [uncultured Prevotellamassilia sp.]
MQESLTTSHNLLHTSAHFVQIYYAFCPAAHLAPQPPHGDEKTTPHHHNTNKPTIKNQQSITTTPPPQHEPSFLNKQ